MAGFAGAIAAPVFGIVSPGQFDYLPSILMICRVAVGGRGVLWRRVLGALLVNSARVTVSAARPDDSLYMQALLFIVVLAFFPGGWQACSEGVGDGERQVPGRPSAAGEPSAAVVPDRRCRFRVSRRRDGSAGGPQPERRVRRLQGLGQCRPHRRAGRVRFLIGHNGAGKTTLIDCITGSTEPSHGEVFFEGRSVARMAEHKRVKLGIGRSFQTPTVFETLTVVDNLDLAESFRSPWSPCSRTAGGCPMALPPPSIEWGWPACRTSRRPP